MRRLIKKAIGFFIKLAFSISRAFHGAQPIPSWAWTQPNSLPRTLLSNKSFNTYQSCATPHPGRVGNLGAKSNLVIPNKS